MNQPPDITAIQAAWRLIQPHVHYTPLMHSRLLDARTGARIGFKCENLQRVGAFKARGACNAVFSLSDAEARHGVATHSSGNHGAALAMAAAQRGIAAHIVMPEGAPGVKRDAVAAYGARIIDCAPTLAAREAALEALVDETGAQAVHPYKDPRVIAGQGTVALEILEQMPELEVLVVPVGGGGLLSGVALAVKALRPEVEVVAAEPAGADDAFRSFGLGELQPQTNPQTIADGLRAGLGEINFGIIQRHVDTILTVEEASIIEAMRLQWTRLKSVVEPSGAVSFAALLEHPERFAGRQVACVISGGNVDIDRLPWHVQ
jgi:threonine dehydratase